jgi:hypothetical protein
MVRASGTSQAAAVVSGAAALLLSARPGLSPDQVKHVLMASAVRPDGDDVELVGAGYLRVDEALGWMHLGLPQTWQPATGLGTLDGARGSVRVVRDGLVLEGEFDIFGSSWSGSRWTHDAWSGSRWTGSRWTEAAATGVAMDGLRLVRGRVDRFVVERVAVDGRHLERIALDRLPLDLRRLHRVAVDGLKVDRGRLVRSRVGRRPRHGDAGGCRASHGRGGDGRGRLVAGSELHRAAAPARTRAGRRT